MRCGPSQTYHVNFTWCGVYTVIVNFASTVGNIFAACAIDFSGPEKKDGLLLLVGTS